MKIAYIVPSLLQAGPVNVVLDLTKLMTSHGHECRVFYFDDLVSLSFPCEVHRISFSTRIHFDDFDVVHTHGLRPNLYVLRHKPWDAKAFFISTFHNYVFEDFLFEYGRLKSLVGGTLFLFSALRHDKIITLSKNAMAYYNKWFSLSKLEYVYNSRILDSNAVLTNTEAEEILNFKEKNILIGTNCSLQHRKGIDLLLQSMVLLPSHYKLFIVGDGADRSHYEKMIAELNLEKRVCLAGMKKDAYRYLPYYDIYVLPSRSEGFPLSLLEAAAYGKQVVCSNIPVFKETFTEKEVIMFELPQVDDLARAILESYEKKDLGCNIQLKFDAEYSPQCMYDKHIHIYKNES